MDSSIALSHPELLQSLVTQAISDPGLPSSEPTASHWQLPPHPKISSIQSPSLPESTEFAIIGSGITGCSIANHLLEATTRANVTVFEARTLCSGASGRNGGGLASFAPYSFPDMIQHYGERDAIEIVRFTYRTLEKMHELGNSSDGMKRASEIRRTREVSGFRDAKTFEETKASFLLLEKMVPEANLKVEVLDPETALRDFGIVTVGGALRFNCGAFWPYRFITTFWNQMREQHSQRLNIETNTPVTGVTFDEDTLTYLIQTTRGTVSAKKVVHATNGYAGHLLPGLRGTIYPVSGFMSAQEPGPSFGRFGRDRSWSFFRAPSLDLTTGVQSSNVYYGNQSPNEDTIFWGSDMAPILELITANDAIVPDVTRRDLVAVLPTQFTGWDEERLSKVKGIWSGIQGFTADNLPVVGEIPPDLSGRGIAGGEWVCAGFNGAGMCQCWPSGEAVARMMLGENAVGILPKSYIASKERFEGVEKKTEASIQEMFLGGWAA